MKKVKNEKMTSSQRPFSVKGKAKILAFIANITTDGGKFLPKAV
jgi:hypothetical protein